MTKPSTRLPLATAEELYEKLKWDEQQLIVAWDVYPTFNFIVTTHHLYFDWILKGRGATPEQTERAKQLPPDAKLLFQAIIEVSNGSKHWTLTRQDVLDRQVITAVSGQGIFDYDSYFLGEMVHLFFDGYLVSMAAASSMIMRYFEWIIYGNESSAVEELSRALAGTKVQPLES